MRIVKALEILSAYCEKHKCSFCRFNSGAGDSVDCLLHDDIPCDWYDEYEKLLKRKLKGEDDE